MESAYSGNEYASLDCCGHIANIGVNSAPIMQESLQLLEIFPNIELPWARSRKISNIYQADEIGCDILTGTNDIIEKLSLRGKKLAAHAPDAVQLFHHDAAHGGYSTSHAK